MRTSAVSYPIVGKLRAYATSATTPESADVSLPNIVESPPIKRKKSKFFIAFGAALLGAASIALPAGTLGALAGKFANNGFSVNKTIVDVEKSLVGLFKK